MPDDPNVKRCEHCGIEVARPKGYSRRQWEERRFCSRECRSLFSRAPRPGCGCGCGEVVVLRKRKFIRGHRPKSLRPDGYVRIFSPKHPLANSDGHVLEHRMVAYDAGMVVPVGYHVHHKNGVKDDNRLENLEVIEKAAHHRMHVRAAGFVVNQYGTWPLRDLA